MEQKNFLLAIVLSVGFLFIWTAVIVPRFTPPAPPQPVEATAPGTAVAPATDQSGQPASVVQNSGGQVIADATSVLKDENNEIVLSARGGGIEHWWLKTKGQDIDLVLYPDVQPSPLATFPDSPAKIFVQGRQAVMESRLSNGLRLTKTLTLSPSGHLHQISLRFQNATGHPVELKDWEWGWGPGLGTVESEHKENARNIRALSLGPLKAHVLKEGEPGQFGRWVGIDNRYFMVALIPQGPYDELAFGDGKKDQKRLRIVASTTVPARGETVLTYKLYVGPKGYTQLKKYGENLEEGVDFGVFSPLGKLILQVLYRLKEVTGNYGLSIVILTICLQVLMFPLTIKSFKAAMSMKKLQPKIADLQARFKNDPKRLNIEMMNLYKNSGTNPFGGCLPMLLQMPIFWALFTTLRNAYELRGQPFYGWIHDLSVHDPLYILPVVMGGAMFMQQRMSGAVSDPTQKQMMMMMPIMFTVMFMNFPAGLVLYWLTNNLVSMSFQYSFQRFTAKNQPPPNVIETTIIK